MSETSLVKTENTSPATVSAPPAATVVPAADLLRTEAGYRLTVDLPGVAADDVEVHLEKGVLSVTATPTMDEDGWETLHGPAGVQRFHRTFPFGDEVDAGKVEARVKAGILTVTLPTPASVGRKIVVGAGT